MPAVTPILYLPTGWNSLGTVIWGDYDNDGYPDIFFTYLTKVQLFRNQGNGTFVDVTSSSGILGKNNCENTGAAWFDYNNDRYLDIYIADWQGCSTNTLYKNNGDGTFTNVTKETNIESDLSYAGFNPFPFDFNGELFQVKNYNPFWATQRRPRVYVAANKTMMLKMALTIATTMASTKTQQERKYFLLEIQRRS